MHEKGAGLKDQLPSRLLSHQPGRLNREFPYAMAGTVAGILDD